MGVIGKDGVKIVKMAGKMMIEETTITINMTESLRLRKLRKGNTVCMKRFLTVCNHWKPVSEEESSEDVAVANSLIEIGADDPARNYC